jgi:hypothetical protein
MNLTIHTLNVNLMLNTGRTADRRGATASHG